MNNNEDLGLHTFTNQIVIHAHHLDPSVDPGGMDAVRQLSGHLVQYCQMATVQQGVVPVAIALGRQKPRRAHDAVVLEVSVITMDMFYNGDLIPLPNWERLLQSTMDTAIGLVFEEYGVAE